MDLFLSICLAILAFATVFINHFYNKQNENTNDNKKNIRLALIIIAGLILSVTSVKSVREYNSKRNAKKTTDSLQGTLNKLESANSDVTYSLSKSQNTLNSIKLSLDSIGLKVNEQGNVSIANVQKLKATVMKINSQTNVTSINQKGGQTSKYINNN